MASSNPLYHRSAACGAYWAIHSYASSASPSAVFVTSTLKSLLPFLFSSDLRDGTSSPPFHVFEAFLDALDRFQPIDQFQAPLLGGRILRYQLGLAVDGKDTRLSGVP